VFQDGVSLDPVIQPRISTVVLLSDHLKLLADLLAMLRCLFKA